MLGEKLKLKLIEVSQMKIKIKNYSAKFKLENFLSGTSQISEIGDLVSVLLNTYSMKQADLYYVETIKMTSQAFSLYGEYEPQASNLYEL